MFMHIYIYFRYCEQNNLIVILREIYFGILLILDCNYTFLRNFPPISFRLALKQSEKGIIRIQIRSNVTRFSNWFLCVILICSIYIHTILYIVLYIKFFVMSKCPCIDPDHIRHVHKENELFFLLNRRELDCDQIFSIDFQLNWIPFGSKSIGILYTKLDYV